MTRDVRLTTIAVVLLGLTACGGGSSAGSTSTSATPPTLPPTIATQPDSRVVPVGQPATFSVVAGGSGLTYAWLRDGVAVPGATAASYTTPTTSTLDDGALFSVVVTNAAGSATSDAARLRIEGFTATGSMGSARQRHAATVLAGGEVLVTGGYAAGILSSAEVYDPLTGEFTGTGTLAAARQNHTATLLASGKVLVIGGEGGAGGGIPLATAELYDPATGLFSPAGAMTTARTLHTATLLPGGKVLVTGGLSSHAAASELASAELYDPATNQFTATANAMGAARYWHAAAVLPGGQVLVAGGYGTGGGALASADLFDPATGRFTATQAMTTARYAHSATLLETGQVLVAGGYGGTFLATAELYDPDSGTFAATGPMTASRYFHTATGLPGGKVLVAGGLGPSGALAGAELFDPAAAAFAGTGALSRGRYLDTASLLPTGEVLIAGGWAVGDTGLASAERYSGAP
jgi:hypothetical protein